LRGSRFLTADVDTDPTFDTLGYSEPDDGCDFDFFSASCSDNAIAINRHTCKTDMLYLAEMENPFTTRPTVPRDFENQMLY